ncbi:hypothetical protein GCM10009119_10790 [Algoriphagus jejuensis]|uniref:Response regulatory domain-containing protein n=1 Tax=Algoriphagus jejuensis TaxID=419934 RepID=A0ABN1MXD8_9BACT
MRRPSKILLVEDDPLIGDMIIEDLLEAFPNGEVTLVGPATSFDEGVEFLRTENPHLALLDISLGAEQAAGIRLAQHINQTSSIPLIFLSGLPKESGFDLAKLTMPHAFLRKPYRSEDLSAQIELLLIRQNQGKGPDHNETNSQPKPHLSGESESIFVVTGHGELTAIPVGDLVLLEADDKILRAFLLSREQPVVFTSPGLKNFFEDHQKILGPDFFQLSRKHVLNTKRILAVKHNHVVLPKHSPNTNLAEHFSIAIPANGNKRKELFAKLGLKD